MVYRSCDSERTPFAVIYYAYASILTMVNFHTKFRMPIARSKVYEDPDFKKTGTDPLKLTVIGNDNVTI